VAGTPTTHAAAAELHVGEYDPVGHAVHLVVPVLAAYVFCGQHPHGPAVNPTTVE
jgi:hypothetical protein